MNIVARIDSALERAGFRQLEVRAIYLTAEDHDEFDRAMRRRFSVKASFLAYGPYQIRRAAKSHVHCKFGVDICIPKKLSQRVRMAA